MALEGVPRIEIAKLLGVTEARVSLILRRAMSHDFVVRIYEKTIYDHGRSNL